MGKKRIKWLDFGKGFTIFGVVLYHSMLYSSIKSFPLLTGFIGIFIMPIFFSISGYLYKEVYNSKDFILLLYKKLTSFIVPYMIFSFILLFLYKKKFASLITSVPKYYPRLSNIAGICYFGVHCTYLWFLFILMFIFILAGLIGLIIHSVKCYIKIFSCVSILIIVFIISKFYSVKQFVLWMLCFYIGYGIKCFKVTRIFNALNHDKIIALAIDSFWLLIVLLQYKLSGIVLDGADDGFSRFDLIAKIFSIIAFLMTFSVLNNNLRIFRYFCKYGKYTLIIYLIHLPIIFILLHFVKNIFINPYLLGTVIFIITWILSIYICKLLYKLKYLDVIFYPRKYINIIINHIYNGYLN